jgi:hypothetical protein
MCTHHRIPPVPLLSLILGYGPMLPIGLAGLGSWFIGGVGLYSLIAMLIRLLTWSS